MNAYQGQIAPASSTTARDIFSLLLRRAWVILLILGLTAGITYFITIRTTKAWTATAQLTLSSHPTNGILSTSAGTDPGGSVDTLVTMMQSPAMLDRTVTHIKNQILDGQIYHDQAHRDTARLARRTMAFLLGEDPDSPNSDLSNPNKDKLNPAIDKLNRALNVYNPRETNLIMVSVEWPKSREAATLLAQAVSDAFYEWKRDILRSGYDKELASLTIRAQGAKIKLHDAQENELVFKEQHSYADPKLQMEEYLRQYLTYIGNTQTLGTEIQEVQAKAGALEKRLKEANQAIRTGVSIRNDSEIERLQGDLNQLQTRRDTDALTYTDKFPGVLSKDDAEIKTAKQKLADALHTVLDTKRPSLPQQTALQNQYEAAQVELSSLQAKAAAAMRIRNQHEAALLNMPHSQLKYERLLEDKVNAQKLYDQLQNALGEVEVSRNCAIPDVVISQNAFSSADPTTPNILRNSLFASVIGLLLTFMAVLMLEQSDQRMRTMSQMRTLMPGPIIGALPTLSRRQLRTLARGGSTDYSVETYSLARANLMLALRNANNGRSELGQVVLVTSAVPGEGKSLTAASLARSAARAGKNVVLVNADMRRPTLNDLFNTDEPNGLADVLIGSMSLDEAIVSSDTDNLAILHSGAPNRNPSDLLSQPRMAAILELLRAEADLIFIDTPPCSVVADALLLAPYADCIVQVVRIGAADQNTVLDTMAALRTAEPRAMVFFANHVPTEHSYGHSYLYTKYGTSADGNGAATSALPIALPQADQAEPSNPDSESH